VNHDATRPVCYERCVQVVDRITPFAPAVVTAVAVGGAVGASGRWFVAWALDAAGAGHVPGTWPWATLVVNVVGCLLIGLAARTLERETVAWSFVVAGLLGGFTTFSALAVELNDLAEAERLPMAVLYGAVTLSAGIAATFVAHRPVEVGE
jgi:CrcB protein